MQLPEDHRPSTVAAITLALAVTTLAIGCGTKQPFGGTPGPPPQGTRFGFNEDASVRSYELQATLGMPIRRWPVAWSDVETEPGRWTWQGHDSEYRAMRANGLSPLLVAIGAPCWAGGATAKCNGRTLDGPQDPAHDSDWAEYVRRLVARYPDAAGIEVWNEPNISPNWTGHPDPLRYTAMLRSAYGAVKGVDPELPVVSGGLFAAPRTGDFAVADSEFLAGMYAAGARGYLDGIGAHPYPFPQDDPGGHYRLQSMKDDIARLRSVQRAAGDSRTPIWITEMGVSTASAPGYPSGVSDEEQATDLRSLINSVGKVGPVPVTLIHRLIDPAYTSSDGALALFESGFGVFDGNGTPKPAACALSRDFHGTLRC